MTDTEWNDTVGLAQAYIARGDSIVALEMKVERLTRELAEARKDATRAELLLAAALPCLDRFALDSLIRNIDPIDHLHVLPLFKESVRRLSPPSAPAQDGAERCEECDSFRWECECNGTGKARR